MSPPAAPVASPPSPEPAGATPAPPTPAHAGAPAGADLDLEEDIAPNLGGEDQMQDA